jgi:hypothetical protein
VRVPPDALRMLSDTAPRPPAEEREQVERPAVPTGANS